MPLVNVKAIEGVFSDTQKQELIGRITDALVAVGGESLRSVIWVVVEDVKSGEWGMAGKPVTLQDVKALATGKRAA